MEIISIAGLSWHAWLTLGVVVSTFGILWLTRLPPDFIFLGGLGVLLVSGVLDAHEALSGFSSPGVITVGVLYVVVAGLQETGGLLWVSHRVLGHPKRHWIAQLRLTVPDPLLDRLAVPHGKRDEETHVHV